MGLVRRFLTGPYESDAALKPGIVDRGDLPTLVKRDGTEVALEDLGNGGSQPDNWCVASASNPSVNPLTDAGDTARILTLTILDQSGTDFSIGEYPSAGRPAIISASGGRFQTAVFVNQPSPATLDPASDQPRYLYIPALCGDIGLNPLNTFGIDIVLPVVAGNWGYGQLFAGTPGQVSPGGPAFHTLNVQLENYVTGDSVPLDQFNGTDPIIAIWQIG